MNKTVGDLLREARNKKGLALQTIERSTGVATHHLLAIELDQFSLIEPDKFDDYLRLYANEVDLDVQELKQYYEWQLAAVPQVTEESEADPFLATDQELVYTPSNLGSRASRRSQRTDHSATQKQKGKGAGLLKGLISLLLLALLGAAVYFVYQNFFTGRQAVETSPASTSSVSSSSQPAASSQPEQPQTQLTVSGGGESLDVVVATSQKPVKVEISLSGAENSWIGVTNSDLGDGGMTLTAEAPTHTATLTAEATTAEIYLGITEGVSIKINDQVLDMSAITSTAVSTINLRIE